MNDLGTLGGPGSAASTNVPGGVAGAADINQTATYHAFQYSDKGMNDLGTVRRDAKCRPRQ